MAGVAGGRLPDGAGRPGRRERAGAPGRAAGAAGAAAGARHPPGGRRAPLPHRGQDPPAAAVLDRQGRRGRRPDSVAEGRRRCPRLRRADRVGPGARPAEDQPMGLHPGGDRSGRRQNRRDHEEERRGDARRGDIAGGRRGEGQRRLQDDPVCRQPDRGGVEGDRLHRASRLLLPRVRRDRRHAHEGDGAAEDPEDARAAGRADGPAQRGHRAAARRRGRP